MDTDPYKRFSTAIMTNNQCEIQSLSRQLTNFLKERHLRKTPERYAILEKAVDLSAHFGVDQLYNALESEGYHVSRATVYNTLELLCEAGILNRHNFSTNLARYEVARGSHLHLICRRCGSIQEINDTALSSKLLSENYDGFIPEYSSSSIYGICRNCVENLHNEQSAYYPSDSWPTIDDRRHSPDISIINTD